MWLFAHERLSSYREPYIRQPAICPVHSSVASICTIPGAQHLRDAQYTRIFVIIISKHVQAHPWFHLVAATVLISPIGRFQALRLAGMGLNVSKCPETTATPSLEVSGDPCLAQCSRTEVLDVVELVNVYDTAWFGEQPSSSEWYTALDCSPPTTPPPKHTRQGLHCSSPTSPIYDSPPPRQANRFTAARECSLPLTTFDSMDDLTEWGRTLYCTADWMPNAKEPNGVINALAANPPSPVPEYKEPTLWTFLPDIPLPVLRSLSDPNPLPTTALSSTDNSSLQAYPAAAQQHLPRTSRRRHRNRTSSNQHHQTANQRTRSTASVVSSRVKNWCKSAVGEVAAAAHHTFWSPLATAVSA